MTGEIHAIFGAGPVGKATARALLKQGKRVKMMNRSGQVADLPAEVERVKGDAYDLAQARTFVQGATSVYQCAQPAYHEWAEKFPPLQSTIIEATASAGAKLVVVENLYMYGDPNGAPIHEKLPYRAHTKKGKVRQAMSEALHQAHQSGKVRVIIGRASNFFGAEYDIVGDFLVYPALAGKTANLFGRLDLPHSYTYIPDFGSALAILGTDERAVGEVWHVPCLEPVPQQAIADSVYAEAGQAKTQVRTAGRWMMSLLGLFNVGARESVEMMYEYEKPYVVDSRKFEQTFALRATPLAQAVRETVAWFKAHPQTAH